MAARHAAGTCRGRAGARQSLPAEPEPPERVRRRPRRAPRRPRLSRSRHGLVARWRRARAQPARGLRGSAPQTPLAGAARVHATVVWQRPGHRRLGPTAHPGCLGGALEGPRCAPRGCGAGTTRRGCGAPGVKRLQRTARKLRDYSLLVSTDHAPEPRPLSSLRRRPDGRPGHQRRDGAGRTRPRCAQPRRADPGHPRGGHARTRARAAPLAGRAAASVGRGVLHQPQGWRPHRDALRAQVRPLGRLGPGTHRPDWPGQERAPPPAGQPRPAAQLQAGPALQRAIHPLRQRPDGDRAHAGARRVHAAHAAGRPATPAALRLQQADEDHRHTQERHRPGHTAEEGPRDRRGAKQQPAPALPGALPRLAVERGAGDAEDPRDRSLQADRGARGGWRPGGDGLPGRADGGVAGATRGRLQPQAGDARQPRPRQGPGRGRDGACRGALRPALNSQADSPGPAGRARGECSGGRAIRPSRSRRRTPSGARCRPLPGRRRARRPGRPDARPPSSLRPVTRRTPRPRRDRHAGRACRHGTPRRRARNPRAGHRAWPCW